MSIVLGAIADDLTGATDLANAWVREGVRVTLSVGVPDETTDEEEAVVVALKSRTAPVAAAVEQSLAVLHWLEDRSARQVVFKYCSTFDSTPSGNIGPVADALIDAMEEDFAVVCPALPENRRTVYQGYLFVENQLLSESPMKDHPSTPMRDSNIPRLMGAQSRYRAGLLPLQEVRAGESAIQERIDRLRTEGCVYGIADAVSDEDLRVLGRALKEHRLITGGSGIGIGLPDNHRGTGGLPPRAVPRPPQVDGRELVLSGSCSTATREQIATVAGLWPTRKLDVDRIAAGEDEIGDTVLWAQSQGDGTPILVYASARPDEVTAIQSRYGTKRAGTMVEAALGVIAVRLRGLGFHRIVIAGGETAGAVVSALGVKALRIGPEIAPGVPWTEARVQPPLALALKSGNFGARSFFSDAFGILP